MNSKIRTMCFIALMAAIICVVAPFTINIGPVPISLASLAVYIAGGLLGWKTGTAAVGIYLLLGAAGVPVFSNFGAGFAKIAGPTGGYLIGYLPCALITGLGADLYGKRSITVLKRSVYPAYPVSMLIGTFVLYALGTAWFVLQKACTVSYALPLCVIPFLPGDAIKIVIASVLCPVLRNRLKLG